MNLFVLKRIKGIFLFLFLSTHILYGQQAGGQDYSNHQQLSQRLQQLARSQPSSVKLQSLARTLGDKDVWVLTVGNGDVANRPAIAIVGGTRGDHPAGSELAVRFAEHLVAGRQSAEIRNLLDSVTFYIFPDLSPDAREQYFLTPRYERLGNANPTDLDRDGTVGEDPFNDLNNDGLITRMRIKDPTGTWMTHPDDARVMVKARPAKAEAGGYLMYSEGIDDDKDTLFNEDGDEGVFIHRNFTFRFPAFEYGAGEHAVSEIESRAVIDFLYAAPNVFAVISFGDANNLTNPLKYNETAATARISTGWQQKDILINEHISHLYRQHMDSVLPGAREGSNGDFFQWAYFHYGRFSFSTQGWTVPVPERRDEYTSDEYNFLQWAESNNLSNVFVPWTKVNHPDFPGKEVEVGGIAPFVMGNPPFFMLDSIAARHNTFILSVAAIRPRVEIRNIKTEKLSGNLFRVTADIYNGGTFPTVSQIGEKVRWVKQTVVRTAPAGNQKVISGKTIDIIGAMDGRSHVQRTWLIQGSGRLTIRAGAESTGFSEVLVNL